MKTESQHIIDCQHGNMESFALLYDAYIQKIYNYIYYKTHHKETAEDLTAKTFLKAYTKIAYYQETKGTFSAWLYRIARNTVVDHYRTEKQSEAIDVWDAYANPSFDRDIDTKQNLEQITKYIETLPQQHREIIIMRVWDELSYKEIAEILGTSEASCKMAFSRAINKLRSEMPVHLFIAFILTSLT